MPVRFCDIKFKKVGTVDEDGCCAYEVVDRDDGKRYGWAWSHIGFSYRGTDGWNSGIRCKDFYPKEWLWSENGCHYGDKCGVPERTRTAATRRLLDSVNGVSCFATRRAN